MTPEAWISLGLACAAAIVWLVRLEGRINTAEKTHAADVAQLKLDLARAEAEIAKTERDLGVAISAVKTRQDADALTHNDTTIALVRMEEQLKHLTGLVERLIGARPAPAPRQPRGGK